MGSAHLADIPLFELRGQVFVLEIFAEPGFTRRIFHYQARKG